MITLAFAAGHIAELRQKELSTTSNFPKQGWRWFVVISPLSG